MKRYLVIFLGLCMVGLIWNNIAPANVNLPYNLINMLLKEPHTWTGTQTFDTVDINGGAIDGTDIGAAAAGTGAFTSSLANESLGGTSTYVIDGDLDMTTLASATAALLTAGRIIELNATASPTVRLPDMNALAGVTNDMFLVDVTLNGSTTPTSGVTIWSPTNKIIAGLGATWTSGDTVFINGGASGNTGYTLTCKALNYGSGVTPTWRVWTDADVIRRP